MRRAVGTLSAACHLEDAVYLLLRAQARVLSHP